ncbi:secondary thiamine-phosphate synthase enzyme YjbQ [Anaerobium acetethylicum]|uniref:Secondary thiamine-phosphate synthase enzyme n=1 Tax=Anaerobium acetethylicum TaxID=1619234 RepID=A0A1D3TTE2_9FIRM|nr:secondary thiamine-phosphate synthase enzyme YjbQ [Anaerobium acetethylicum]SCP97253.1 secondary thiamine-phosphate synthase enzyme [Anaerobium acetethylicum]
MLKKFQIQTKFNEVYDITADVKKFVEESKVESGLCLVYNPHSTAGMTITSFWDPKGFDDLQDELCRLIPTRVDFKHQHDTPQDAAGHVKSSLLGVSLPFIVEDGKLLVGGSQGIFFVEFDGPRNREYYVKIMAD